MVRSKVIERRNELSFRQIARRGVIAEFVPKRTLSSIEERGAGISQRPKPILERFGRPDVVAIKTDVFPAEWSDVGQQRVGQDFALDAKLGDGAAEIRAGSLLRCARRAGRPRSPAQSGPAIAGPTGVADPSGLAEAGDVGVNL